MNARLWHRIDAYWFTKLAPERLALLRILVGGFAFLFLVVQFHKLTDYSRFALGQFQPVGVASLLHQPAPLWLPLWIAVVAVVLSLAFATGFYFRVTGPLFACIFLCLTTYRHAWGQIFHTDNLLVLHVIILSIARSADAYSLDQRTRRITPTTPHGRYGWPVRLMCVVVVLAYFISGVAKLKASGLGWMSGEVLRNHIAFDNLRKVELGHIHSPIGAALLPYAWLFTPFAIATLLIELGAPLALVHPLVAKVWVLSAYLFHVGIVALMAIVFAYPLSGIPYLPFFLHSQNIQPGPLRISAYKTR